MSTPLFGGYSYSAVLIRSFLIIVSLSLGTALLATAPIAKCNDALNISLSGVGFAAVSATEVDAGSYDAGGGPVRLEVRRSVQGFATEPAPGAPITNFGAWGNQVTFDCSDAGLYVRIELRVWDNANGDGTVGGPGDASNVCWMDVLIENKITPTCLPPGPVSTDCQSLPVGFPNNLAAAFGVDPQGTTILLNDLFGTASATSSCGATLTELAPLDGRSCGVGTIVRRFEASSVGSNGVTGVDVCTQQITVTGVHDYAIRFPADVSSSDCQPVAGGDATGIEIGCDLLSFYQDTMFFSASGDECFKLRKEIQVINWCEYDGVGDPYSIGRDEDGDNLPGETVWVTVDQDLAAVRATQNGPILRLLSDYANSSSRGYYKYYQFIKVYDNAAPVITVEAAEETYCSLQSDCQGSATFELSVADDCTPEDLTVTASLDQFVVDANGDGIITLAEFTAEATADVIQDGSDYTVAVDLPFGRHAVRVVAEDGCGNTAAELIVFEIVDCKAVGPTCINGLTVTLMPTGSGGGMMEIWASDFLASPIDDCSGIAGYGIYRTTDVIAAGEGFTPDIQDTGLTLDCDDAGMLAVRIYAIDGAGNADYCETTLLVQANTPGLCTGDGSIAGIIATETNEPVGGVSVSISGAMNVQLNTGATGQYASGILPLGQDYTVTPAYDADPKNGVSTFDIVIIQKHILGVQPLNSPYKIIAADANGDGQVTTLDLIFLRRLVLDLDTELSTNTSWRFIEADYEFPDTQNPWREDFPEIHNANDLPGNILANFIAVKVGDVNGSAQGQ